MHSVIRKGWLSNYSGTSVRCLLKFGVILFARVSHLVLIDAWGFPEKPKKITNLMYMENPIVIQMMRMLSTQICPFAMFRLMGPWGMIG